MPPSEGKSCRRVASVSIVGLRLARPNEGSVNGLLSPTGCSLSPGTPSSEQPQETAVGLLLPGLIEELVPGQIAPHRLANSPSDSGSADGRGPNESHSMRVEAVFHLW